MRLQLIREIEQQNPWLQNKQVSILSTANYLILDPQVFCGAHDLP